MSTKGSSSSETVALVVFGDLSREEFSRIKPLMEVLALRSPSLQVVFVPISDRVKDLKFPYWAEKGAQSGWKAVIFLPFVRLADLPWIGSGQMGSLPVFFLKNPGLYELNALTDEIFGFLSLDPKRPGEARKRSARAAAEPTGAGNDFTFDLMRPRPGDDQEEELWLRVRGGVDLIEKVPFLFQYLSIFPAIPDETHTLPTGEAVYHLKNELFEKEITIKRLLRSEKRYKKFFEDDITGDFVMDMNWRVTDCNRSFARIFGFPSIDYALGYDIRQLFPNRESRRKTVTLFRQLNYLDYHELELLRPDGQVVHIISNLLGIKNDEGRLIQVRGFLFDNTPRKNLEKQLRESQKMEGLGRLAGGIAHDFNNLLTVINGYTELLIAEMPDDSPYLGELGEILHAGLRAAELTSQLLAFSRRQVLTPRILSLNEIVSSLENMLQRLMNEQVHFKIDLDPRLPPLKADKGQLEQVVLNLVLNARDAMPQGGDLIVKTEAVNIETSAYSGGEFILPGTYVALRVKDTGVGMDEETQKRIFEPFFTTKEQGKGTGLGLAMVYGIVQQSGGYLSVESEPGRGSTFSILFNAHDVFQETERPLSVDLSPIPRGDQEKIILVEDEEMVRDYTLRILVRYGYKVKAFLHGGEALEFIRNSTETWDLILTDVVMPVMTGPELINHLISMGYQAKFLYMSGYTDDEIVRHGIYSNQVMFIHKPFKSKEILAMVREVLDMKS